MRRITLILILFAPFILKAQYPSGDEILDRIDQNGRTIDMCVVNRWRYEQHIYILQVQMFLQEQGIKSLLYAVAIFIFTLAISYFIVSGMNISNDPFFMSLVLSTTSVGVVLPTLRETGLSKTNTGQTIILSAIVADFATMILLT